MIARCAALAVGEAVFDLAVQLVDRFAEGGSQRMIHRLGREVRARRDKMQRYPEGRTHLRAQLERGACFINMANRTEAAKLLFEVLGEGGGGLVIEIMGENFHGETQCP